MCCFLDSLFKIQPCGYLTKNLIPSYKKNPHNRIKKKKKEKNKKKKHKK